jgi:hypothetical protein
MERERGKLTYLKDVKKGNRREVLIKKDLKKREDLSGEDIVLSDELLIESCSRLFNRKTKEDLKSNFFYFYSYD